MKYGIKHTTGVVEALRSFPNDVLPEGFIEVTEPKYEEFLAALQDNVFVTYDVEENTLTEVEEDQAENELSTRRNELRQQLRELSIEIDLATRMEESTIALQDEFDDVQALYEGLEEE